MKISDKLNRVASELADPEMLVAQAVKQAEKLRTLLDELTQRYPADNIYNRRFQDLAMQADDLVENLKFIFE